MPLLRMSLLKRENLERLKVRKKCKGMDLKTGLKHKSLRFPFLPSKQNSQQSMQV